MASKKEVTEALNRVKTDATNYLKDEFTPALNDTK